MHLSYAQCLGSEMFRSGSYFPVRSGSGSYHKTWLSKLFAIVADPEYIMKKIRIRVWDLFDPGSGIGPPSRINLHIKLTGFYVKKFGSGLGSGGGSRTIMIIPDPTWPKSSESKTLLIQCPKL
jgi:hypothetical protein